MAKKVGDMSRTRVECQAFQLCYPTEISFTVCDSRVHLKNNFFIIKIYQDNLNFSRERYDRNSVIEKATFQTIFYLSVHCIFDNCIQSVETVQPSQRYVRIWDPLLRFDRPHSETEVRRDVRQSCFVAGDNSERTNGRR